MGQQYNGNAANPGVPGAIPIALSTNTNPILIQTTLPHGLSFFDRVTIRDHATNTNANGGPFPITFIDSTHFTIPATGNGVGGNTGVVVPLTMGATYQIPSDGDAVTAASVNIGFTALGDRTALLASNMARWRLISIYDFPNDDNTTEATALASFAANGSPAWVNLVAFGGWGPNATFDGGANILQGGDLIDIEVTGSANWTSGIGGTLALLGLGMAFGPAGGAVGAQNKISGTGQRLPTFFTVASALGTCGFHLRGHIAVPNGSALAQPGIQVWANAASGTISILGDYQVRARAYRSTDYLSRVG